MSRKFNIHGEDHKEKMKEFQEILNSIDKKKLADAFKWGIEVGFFKNLRAQDDLYLQFNDGQYVYSIIRMPVKHIKRPNPTSPVSMSILKSTTTGGGRF